MRREYQHKTLTPEQLALLSDIFRVILREVKSDKDLDKIAPGEMAIDYVRGNIWIRNPYTGKLMSPNNAERLKTLGKKVIPGTDLFNADMVHGITFYTDLIELDKINMYLTPDSVIRQMHRPAVLYAHVDYDNYEMLGWPSRSGMVLVLKASEDAVIIKYYTDVTGLEYTGSYNPQQHFFEGWRTSSGISSSEYEGEVLPGDGGEHGKSDLPGFTLQDFVVVYLTLRESLYPGATININDTGDKPILDIFGEPLKTEIVENTTIMLIYDYSRDAWRYTSSAESTIGAILKVVTERVAEYRDETGELSKAFQKELDKYQDLVMTTLREYTEKHDRKIAELEERIAKLETYMDALIKHEKDNNLHILDVDVH